MWMLQRSVSVKRRDSVNEGFWEFCTEGKFRKSGTFRPGVALVEAVNFLCVNDGMGDTTVLEISDAGRCWEPFHEPFCPVIVEGFKAAEAVEHGFEVRCGEQHGLEVVELLQRGFGIGGDGGIIPDELGVLGVLIWFRPLKIPDWPAADFQGVEQQESNEKPGSSPGGAGL